jgi:UDP-N-acetylmuramoyl-L-alanyl-D-glutamate--2,6-diaminopimelate ligase
LSDLQLGPNGSTFQWSDHAFSMPIAGPFNVMNALQAGTAARLLGIELDAIATGMAATHVAGRFEPVDVGQPFAVYVDFAHTPDGLERVLEAARQTLQSGRLISVFGCGGDRDRAKRPLMAEIGARVSDVAFFTSDNPRSETIDSILEDMLDGVSDRKYVHIEPDRRRAIEMAFREAKAGDVVVIAGKGHEQGQESNGVVTPFDDRTVSGALLRELGLAS